MPFTTAEFQYRTCANGADRKARRYDVDYDGKLGGVNVGR